MVDAVMLGMIIEESGCRCEDTLEETATGLWDVNLTAPCGAAERGSV